MTWYGVSIHLSVPALSSRSKPAAVGLLLWVWWAGDIDYCSSGMRQTNAGNATLSAYVAGSTLYCLFVVIYYIDGNIFL